LAPHETAGKIKFTAITASSRHKNYPDVPTAKELGFDYEYVFWRGVLAPKDTPRPIVDKLAAAFKRMSEDPAVVSQLNEWGDSTNYLGPDEFAAWWRAEYENQKKLADSMK